MASTVADLLVPPFGSVASLLMELYSEYEARAETMSLCRRLHGRLEGTLNELSKIDIKVIQQNGVVQKYLATVRELYIAVTAYNRDPNPLKRFAGAKKIKDQVNEFHERLDDIQRTINVVDYTSSLVWREEYRADRARFQDTLQRHLDNQEKILSSVQELKNSNPSNLEELALRLKRDLQANQDSISPALLHTMNSIVVAAEAQLGELGTAPQWIVAADEIVLPRKAFHSGRGARVYLADWQGVDVAVKMYKVANATNRVFLKGLTTWRNLSHPNVAQLYGAGAKDGHPFYVYEYARHRSLDKWTSNCTQSQVLVMLHEAALALSYLHSKRIVHGNMSCEKLLVDANGKVKLYGFEASYFRNNSLSNSLRTPMREEFKAPECLAILDGVEHSPSFRSDIYSFGLTILEALSGKAPFQGIAFDDVVFMKENNDLERPKELCDDLDDLWRLVQQMCCCDPQQRVSMAHVLSELRRIAYGSPSLDSHLPERP